MDQRGVSRTLGTACTKAHRRERVCSVPGKIKARAGAIRTNQWEGRRGRNEAEEGCAPSPKVPRPGWVEGFVLCTEGDLEVLDRGRGSMNSEWLGLGTWAGT